MERLRRWLAHNLLGVVLALALASPLLVALGKGIGVNGASDLLASLPERPGTWYDATEYPRKLERWINENFSGRVWLIELNNRARYKVFKEFPTIQVIQGRHKRIFLSAHATYQEPYSAITIPCGYTPHDLDAAADDLNRFLLAFRGMGWDLGMLIAPSGPILYSEELPRWLRQACAASPSPIRTILQSPRLDAAVRPHLYYPLEEMRALKRSMEVFPKAWFHWSGAGPRAVAGMSTKFFWGIDPAAGTEIVTSRKEQFSDISHLFPGIELKSEILVPDYGASGIAECFGPPCFPDLSPIPQKLGVAFRYRSPAAPGGKVVILSDSFGQFIVGWYSRYFKEVVHFSTNFLRDLDETERERFRRYLRDEARAAKLLLIYHDGALLYERLPMDLKVLAPEWQKPEPGAPGSRLPVP